MENTNETERAGGGCPPPPCSHQSTSNTMNTTLKVKNIGSEMATIPGFGTFDPGESRVLDRGLSVEDIDNLRALNPSIHISYTNDDAKL